MTVRYHMRNEFVLVRIRPLDKVHGLVMPETSIQGKEFIVEEIGPLVKDLKPGDKVLMKGSMGIDYYPLPSDSLRIVIEQKNVVLSMEEIEDSN